MDELNPELYKKLFEYIENGCKQHVIEKDYVKYLLSMEQAESIEQLINIYNNIYKLLAIIFYGSKNVPNSWYKHEYWGVEPHSIVLDLSQFFNENLLSWFKRQSNPTVEKCSLCITNLRECINSGYIERRVLSIAGETNAKSINVWSNWRRLHHECLLEINKLDKYGKHYVSLISKYKVCSIELASCGRIFDVVEEAFAKQHNIDYNELLVQHKKKLEEEEIARKKEEEQKTEEATNKKVKNFLAVVVIITLCIIFMIIIEKLGFFGIIIIIGLIGLIPKIFLTGKI